MKYQLNSKAFDEILINLNNTIDNELIPLVQDMKKVSIHPNWVGIGANSFDSYYDNVMKDINTIPIKLLICKKYLEQALNNYSDTNQQLTDMFKEMEDEIDALSKGEGDYYGKI